MADRMLDLMLKLDAARGISGLRRGGRGADARRARAAHRTSSRAIRSAITTSRSGARRTRPVLMLCAHMDELGFLVQHIEDEGFLRLAPVGYHDDRMLTDQVLEIQGLERARARRRGHEARARRERRGAPAGDPAARDVRRPRHGEPRGDRGARRPRRRPDHVRAHGHAAERHARVHGQGGRRPLGLRRDDRDDAEAGRARHRRDRRGRGERAGGARSARRRPGGLPRPAGRRDRARRHARGRHAGDRVPPAADQARRRSRDQVLRLGSRGRRSAPPCRAA